MDSEQLDPYRAERVAQKMREWGMAAGDEHLVLYWLRQVLENSDYLTFMYVPITLRPDGVPVAGTVVLCSTPSSTRALSDNSGISQLGQPVTHPHWLWFSVWWFPGLVPLNVVGMQRTEFQGHCISEELGAFLDLYYSQHGIRQRNWRETYVKPTRGGYYLESLRNILRDGLGIYSWVECTCGRSQWAYLGIDLYMRIHPQPVFPTHEAHYLLNTYVPVRDRKEVDLQEWWTLYHLESVGQSEVFSEAIYEVTRIPLPLSIASRIERVAHQSGENLQEVIARNAHVIRAARLQYMERLQLVPSRARL